MAERRIRRVFVAVKRTAFARLTKDDSEHASRMLDLIGRDAPSVHGLKASHEEHQQSLQEVRRILRQRDLEVVERSKLPARPIEGFDLLIAVGGDGMVLGLSHAVRSSIPVLGINSAPSFSVGYLSGCRADDLAETLDRIESNELEPVEVQRLQVAISKKVLPEPVLNDALFCADHPALICKYRLQWPDGSEVQRSSGVWVSTPAGSTSALASAGGPILPLTTRQFAFLVREPYSPPGESVRLRSAVLAEDQALSLECRTAEASVFLDGSHRQYPVAFGETVSFRLHPQPLRLFHST
jgi:NAD+ kinase